MKLMGAWSDEQFQLLLNLKRELKNEENEDDNKDKKNEKL